MRYVEIALFLIPFVIFAVWRMTATAGGGPSRRVVATSVGLLALVLAALLWFHQQGAVPSGAAYVPATLQNGRIVPAHGAPR
jgi:MYXO-CTERM domain-containing protein